jgi:hypothetical protein
MTTTLESTDSGIGSPPTAAPASSFGDRLGEIAEWVRTRRTGTARAIAAIMLALVAVVTHLEIDRLIAGILAPETGRSAPLSGVISPLAIAERRDAWEIWSTADSVTIGRLILVSLLVDAVFILAYGWMLWLAIRRTSAPRMIRWVLLTTLLALEVVEAMLLADWASHLIGGGTVPEWITWASAFASTAKWVAAAAVLLSLLYDRRFRRFLVRVLRNGARAVWLHRLSAVLVVALFVLTCIPSDGVLDQLPDLQRQWTDDGGNWGQIVLSAAIVAGAWFAAFAFGRMRTRAPIQKLREAGDREEAYAYPRMEERTGVSPYAMDGRRLPMKLRPVDWWWIAPAVGFVVVVALSWLFAGNVGVHWTVAVIFLAIPVVVVAASLLTAYAPFRWSRAGRVQTRADYGWMAGDVIAVLIPCVVGLGLVRSLAGVIAGTHFAGLGTDETRFWLAWFLFVGGAVVAVVVPFVLLRDHPLRTESVLDPTHDVAASGRIVLHYLMLGAAMLAALVLLVCIMVWPVWFAEVVGAQGTTVAVLTLWGVLLGSFTVVLQEFPPLPIFVRMRLLATPVLTLGVTIPFAAGIIVASLGGDDAALHAPRAMPDGATSELASDDAAHDQIDARLEQIADENCTLELDDGSTVRPVLVVAAEGGGIRAAYWTATAFEALRTRGGCLDSTVLLSSGVSGGSVGMAITAALEQGHGLYDVETMLDRLATPETVAVGAAGLLVRDQVAGLSGIRVFTNVPAVGDETSTEARGWDRAALIERSWIHDIPRLAKAPDWAAASTAIGIPVFNSTDARTKCKVLVTPLTVAPARGVTTEADADATADSPAEGEENHWNCVDAGDAPAVLPVPPECFAQLDWAGVAMLSARFPTITPAGRVAAGDSCGQEDLQLIDGGYAEGSSLGTVAELAPLITGRIAALNDEAGADAAPLVPIVLYFKNSAGYDLRGDVDKVAAEPLVPLVGFAASAKQQLDAVLLQRVSTAFGQTGGAADEIAELAGDDGPLPGLAITVAPRTVPTIVPPLGWSLSEFSSDTLDRALDEQLSESGHNGMPTLRTLFDLAR